MARLTGLAGITAAKTLAAESPEDAKKSLGIDATMEYDKANQRLVLYMPLDNLPCIDELPVTEETGERGKYYTANIAFKAQFPADLPMIEFAVDARNPEAGMVKVPIQTQTRFGASKYFNVGLALSKAVLPEVGAPIQDAEPQA